MQEVRYSTQLVSHEDYLFTATAPNLSIASSYSNAAAYPINQHPLARLS
jgi:hypothetical protein